MTQPLLQPALLVSENCPECTGTGTKNAKDCTRCEGSGREVREVPMSEAFEMMQTEHERVVAPPPSELRAAATGPSGWASTLRDGA